MPKITATEWLLARITTPARAVAIYGDLTELATTRGRLWFWPAYVRALISLGWRMAFAFVVGCASLTALFRLHTLPIAWHDSPHPYLQGLVFFFALQLSFLGPFAAVRYGFGDRLARLGLSALLITTGIILSASFRSPWLAVAVILAVASLFAHTSWRRPAILLLTTAAVGAFTLLNLLFLAHMACWIDEHKPLNASSHYYFFDTGFAFPHTLFWVVVWSMALLDAFVLALVCSAMHRWLLERPQPALATHN